MRMSIGVAGLALALLACQDRTAPIPTSPGSLRSQMAHERSRNDFDFAAVTNRDGSPADAMMLAIVDHAFAVGEIARAVRDPSTPGKGIVVLSAGAFHDHALFLASSALELDIRSAPSITAPRLLRVWEDGRVTSEGDGLVGRVEFSSLPADRTTGILEYLRARSADEATVEIPRIGRARLMKF